MTVTYNGTTAGSTSQNPPVKVASIMASAGNSPGMQGRNWWFYQSTNYSTDISNSGSVSITDGQALGMQAGDWIFGSASTGSNSTVPFLYVACVISVSTSGVYTSSNVLSSTHA